MTGRQLTGRVLVVAVAISLAGCLGDGKSGPSSARRCPVWNPPDPPPPVDGGPAVVALLGDFDRYPSELAACYSPWWAARSGSSVATPAPRRNV
jgi:hypothetical protein